MYKNVHIFCKNPAKNIERFGIYLKNQRKGLKVLYVLILGEFGIIRNPRLRMSDSPGSHAGAGINKERS